MINQKQMASNIQDIQNKITAALAKRTAIPITGNSVRLIAVSKFQALEAIRQAYTLGITNFGENRVQELVAKLSELESEPLNFDMIGTLQSNKVKYIVGKVQMIQSVDSENLLNLIAKQAEKRNLVQDILLQVNYSEESSKHGSSSAELSTLLMQATALNHVRLRGLMTMAAPGLSYDEQLQFFHSFYQVFCESKEQLAAQGKNEDFEILSMGMSEDFEAAITAGSNCVRIGRAIFGERA